MKYFEHIKIDNEKYNDFFILLTYESPLNHIEELNKILINSNKEGYIIIDTLLHSGKSEDRYIELFWNGNSIDYDTIKYVKIKNKKYAKTTCQYLKNNIDILESSILNKYQVNLISNGITI